MRFDPRRRVAAGVADLERKALAFADDGRRIAEQPLETLDVERRRHGDEAQVLAERACRVQRQRQREVIVEAALVHLVEQHRRDAGELRVGLDA